MRLSLYSSGSLLLLGALLLATTVTAAPLDTPRHSSLERRSPLPPSNNYGSEDSRALLQQQANPDEAAPRLLKRATDTPPATTTTPPTTATLLQPLLTALKGQTAATDKEKQQMATKLSIEREVIRRLLDGLDVDQLRLPPQPATATDAKPTVEQRDAEQTVAEISVRRNYLKNKAYLVRLIMPYMEAALKQQPSDPAAAPTATTATDTATQLSSQLDLLFGKPVSFEESSAQENYIIPLMPSRARELSGMTSSPSEPIRSLKQFSEPTVMALLRIRVEHVFARALAKPVKDAELQQLVDQLFPVTTQEKEVQAALDKLHQDKKAADEKEEQRQMIERFKQRQLPWLRN